MDKYSKAEVGQYYCITDTYKPYYYQMPKGLFVYERYRKLDLLSKVVYSILMDRIAVSRKNNWIDKYGRIYLCFKQQELGDLLNTNRSTICRAMKRLEEYDLIKCEEQGRGRTSRIYIKKMITPTAESEINNAEENLGKAELEAEELERMENPAFSVAVEQPACAYQHISEKSRDSAVAPTQPPVAQGQQRVAPTQPAVAPVQPIVRMNNQDLLSKTNKSKTYHEEDDDRGEAPPQDDVQQVIKFYEKNNNHAHQCGILEIEHDILVDYCHKYSCEWVSEAIKQSVIYGHPHLQYISKILMGWEKNGFKQKPAQNDIPNLNPVKTTVKKPQNKSAQDTYNGAKEILEKMGMM